MVFNAVKYAKATEQVYLAIEGKRQAKKLYTIWKIVGSAFHMNFWMSYLKSMSAQAKRLKHRGRK